MRLVAHPLQKKERVGVALQDHRIALPRHEHPLFGSFDLGTARRGLYAHLGKTDGIYPLDAQFGHGRQSHRQLSSAAVDDDQIRQIGFLLASAEAALEHFQHHAKIVAPRRRVDAANAKMPVEILVRLAVDKRDH